eukprot:TRINITY_DN56288_c0_g1_i1.p1 TRINITY_DN56288_c0_g1~~TRINITY_DN56288_c0_g1_i1.p1  ORF type:complete len:144 (+),score=13.82 TRINITY_DN56288_c0_g1_i1:69-500(+)
MVRPKSSFAVLLLCAGYDRSLLAVSAVQAHVLPGIVLGPNGEALLSPRRPQQQTQHSSDGETAVAATSLEHAHPGGHLTTDALTAPSVGRVPDVPEPENADSLPVPRHAEEPDNTELVLEEPAARSEGSSTNATAGARDVAAT